MKVGKINYFLLFLTPLFHISNSSFGVLKTKNKNAFFEPGNCHFSTKTIDLFLQYNFVGRILGPRGLTAKQLEQETGCKIMVRGKGSMRDKKKVSDFIGRSSETCEITIFRAVLTHFKKTRRNKIAADPTGSTSTKSYTYSLLSRIPRTGPRLNSNAPLPKSKNSSFQR